MAWSGRRDRDAVVRSARERAECGRRDPAGRRRRVREASGRVSEPSRTACSGSAAEAEDAVQETFLRWQAADREQVRVPAAWLTRVLTNLCLTQLQSARARREVYVGQWLPEPLLDGDPMLGPADTVEQRESVSTAVLVLMERLTPTERAVYVLREAFSYSHAEIAELLDITEASSQQVFHRAKQHLATRAGPHRGRPRGRAAGGRGVPRGRDERPDRAARAAADRRRDGRGRRRRHDPGARRGRSSAPQAVAQFLRGLFRPARRQAGSSSAGRPTSTRGPPTAARPSSSRSATGSSASMTLEVTDDGIAAVLSQVNPDKLGRATRQWAASDHGEPLHHRLVTQVTPPGVRDRAAVSVQEATTPPRQELSDHEAPHRHPRSRLRRSLRRRPPGATPARRRRRDHPGQRRAGLRRAGPHAPARDRPGPARPPAARPARRLGRGPARRARDRRSTSTARPSLSTTGRRARATTRSSTPWAARATTTACSASFEHAHEVASRPGALRLRERLRALAARRRAWSWSAAA